MGFCFQVLVRFYMQLPLFFQQMIAFEHCVMHYQFTMLVSLRYLHHAAGFHGHMVFTARQHC